MNKNDRGISMITVVITVIVLLILTTISMRSSTDLIDNSTDARDDTDVFLDNDEIKSLLTHAIVEEPDEGIQLMEGRIVVIGSGDKEYGAGFHLIPGGEDEVIEAIREKTGDDTIKKYKNLTAPYVVNYTTGEYERIEELKFK